MTNSTTSPLSTLALLGSALLAPPVSAQAPPPPSSLAARPIADNSFLIEEAYNQERRAVQHISVFQRAWGSAAWAFAFTQEWPLRGQRHQLSFTVPLQRVELPTGPATGLGDLALNYRLQLLGTETRVSAAPRVSLILPTGDEERGFGGGAPGLQVNLPVSVTLSPWLVAHGNAGVTHTPSARDGTGARAAATGWNAGGSVIWLVRPAVNLLLEMAWGRTEAVVGPGQTAASETWVVNPGIRWAHNFRNGLQIVPGVAFPIGIGPSAGERSLLLYVSFEHPF
jgi:hypothetical protein